MAERHPVDVLTDDLTRTYAAGASRLALIVQAGLRRGLDPERAGGVTAVRGDATLAYRERQLRAATAVLEDLKREGGRQAGTIAARAYGAGILAVDRTAIDDLVEVAPRFGGIHARAVEALATNMDRSLSAAVDRAGDNLERVFARANALERGLPVRGGPAGAATRFLGRRRNDPWRRVTLDVVAEGLVILDTRKQVSSAMVRRLIAEGVSDATTGFVDSAGRRWSLDRYAAMAARTTTREAATAATVNRMTEHGLDLVTISSHDHAADECTPYDGGTFSLDGSTEGYDVLDEVPPFHPNCVHVLTPASANLDRYLEELERGATEAPPAPAAEIAPSPAEAAANLDAVVPPFSPQARPSSSAASAERLEAQRTRALIDADPGPDPDAEAARDRAHDLEARRVKRSQNKYLRDTLGEDLTHFIGLKWGRDEMVRERFLEGELSVDDVNDLAYKAALEADHRAAERAFREQNAGFQRGAIPCFICGKFKARPSAVCESCGDDPLTHGGSAQEFDRAYGYDAAEERTGGFDDPKWSRGGSTRR